MKILKWTTIPMGLCIGLTAFASDHASIRPGMWQFESKATVTGMPFAMPARSNTYKQCVTQEEAKKIWQSASESKQEKCQYTDLKKTGNHVAWKMKCTGASNMEGHGELTFESSTAYHGIIDMTMQGDGQSMNTHMELNARRIGDCKVK